MLVKRLLQDYARMNKEFYMISDKKFAYFLPNTFTALNIACGFAAIMMAMNGAFYRACMFIVLGAIFDSVDGRIARLTGTQSAFGEQFDSMSDLISFGMAPALIFYLRFLQDFGRLGIVCAFLFLLCGALRLARFNANIDKVKSDYFQGIPIPGAATALIGFTLFSTVENHYYSYFSYLAPIYISFYAYLMVSTFPFPSFKNSPWVQGHKKQVLLFIFMILIFAFLYEEYTILVVIKGYVFGSLTYYFLNRNKLMDEFKEKADHEESTDNL